MCFTDPQVIFECLKVRAFLCGSARAPIFVYTRVYVHKMAANRIDVIIIKTMSGLYIKAARVNSVCSSNFFEKPCPLVVYLPRSQSPAESSGCRRRVVATSASRKSDSSRLGPRVVHRAQQQQTTVRLIYFSDNTIMFLLMFDLYFKSVLFTLFVSSATVNRSMSRHGTHLSFRKYEQICYNLWISACI